LGFEKKKATTQPNLTRVGFFEKSTNKTSLELVLKAQTKPHKS
jgi:hypothetical protein